MTERPDGAFVIWVWGNREIENPKILKRQLLELCSRGFSGALATLRDTRYEFMDARVLRTIAQVSQWAHKRRFRFWFQTDPRQASRTLISKTGERMQNLLAAQNPSDGLDRTHPHIAPVKNNKFMLRYRFPRFHPSPMLKEKALCFEPSGLERVFLFQKSGHRIIHTSIRDITPYSNFYTNMIQCKVELSGEITTPPGESWWVMGFPRFDTNHYDYAGRESNDLLSTFVEDLFDACTHLDGISWGNGETGYVVDTGRFPVSLSLYNSFLAEYGYDLRNVLYSLVMDVDDNTHIRVRVDYYHLLMDMVFGAEQDFHRMIHSFFKGLDVGLHHTVPVKLQAARGLVQGSMDPWKSLKGVGSVFTEVKSNGHQDPAALLASLAITRSLGIFSRKRRAFFNLMNMGEDCDLSYWMDILALHSIHGLIPLNSGKPRKPCPWNVYETLNHQFARVKDITGLVFPTANTALIYPMETLMARGDSEADELVAAVNGLIGRLVMAGVHLDVLSPCILKQAKVTREGTTVQNRRYDTIIYPYPEVLDPQILEVISLMAKAAFPILLGGCKPSFTTRGKRIPHVLPVIFDPSDENLDALWNEGGMTRLITVPDTALSACIPHPDGTLFLLAPSCPGNTFKGDVLYSGNCFFVEKTDRLTIYQEDKPGKVKKIL
ncbi:MAG TPA: hypothetical protein ENN03_12275 [bacterium]|nr:hypothetical protein [bacterium]